MKNKNKIINPLLNIFDNFKIISSKQITICK
jgi:hypothetical protein